MAASPSTEVEPGKLKVRECFSGEILFYLGQETTKEVPFKLEAKCLDKTPKFRCRVAVILPREPTHLNTNM